MATNPRPNFGEDEEMRCEKCDHVLKRTGMFNTANKCPKCGFDNGKIELVAGGIKTLPDQDWIKRGDGHVPEEILLLTFSNIYGYQLHMHSSNRTNSNGLPHLDQLHFSHWMRLPKEPRTTENNDD